MVVWEAVWRIDTEEYFCTYSMAYKFETTDLVEAANLINVELGGHCTLISLSRII